MRVQSSPLAARRALLAGALAACAPPPLQMLPPLPAFAEVRDCSGICGYTANDRGPALNVALPSTSGGSAALSDFLAKDLYVVLWFYPDDPSGVQDAGNRKEAGLFEVRAVAVAVAPLPAAFLNRVVTFRVAWRRSLSL